MFLKRKRSDDCIKDSASVQRQRLVAALQPAWRLVRKSSGGPGIDGQRIRDVSQQLDMQLERIANQLSNGTYVFRRLRAARVEKRSGGIRRLEIPTVRDRIVLQSMRLCIEPQLEPQMSPASHAFRSNRGAHTAINQIRLGLRKRRRWVLNADIQSFFPSVVHRLMMNRLKTGCTLPDLTLYNKAIRMSASRFGRRRGIAQGSPLSPLLSNVYLNAFDDQQATGSGTFVRYCDDMVFLFDDLSLAKKRLRQIKRQLSSCGLRLNASKTFVVDCAESSFDYLGFQIGADSIAPSPTSIDRLKQELHDWFTRPRTKRQKRLQHINGLLRSFAWYFSVADNKSAFRSIDQYVQQLRQRRAKSRMRRTTPSANELFRLTTASKCPKQGRAGARCSSYSY